MAAFSSYLLGLGAKPGHKPMLAPAPGTGLAATPTSTSAPVKPVTAGSTVLTSTKPAMPPAPTVLGTPKPAKPKPAAMGAY